MKNYNIAIIGLGYWGTIVTNTVISMGLFNNIYIHDNDISKVKIIKKNLVIKLKKKNLMKLKTIKIFQMFF